jgi:uncharacterized protein YndB with AHSA1/START domain
MAPETVQNAVFRKTLHVEVPIDTAFRVFTDRMGAWWPASHHVGGTPFQDILIDHHAGGRWYEINVKGEECIWGTVLAWEPPRTVVLSWHLQPDWTFSPDLARASEVALQFIAEGPERTRVEFEHRHLERHGAGWEKLRNEVGSEAGWPAILALYVGMAQGSK